MMTGTMSCSVFIAMSLDGCIAGPDGSLDWLTAPGPEQQDEESYGYPGFIGDMDALVMGRRTFEKILTFPEGPYSLPVVVLSTREAAVPTHLHGRVQTAGGPPGQVVKQLAEQGLEHLYIDGGVTIQRFLQAGLIDRMVITVVPVLLGEGLPLFGRLSEQVRLDLLDSRAFPNGFVQLDYAVKRR